MSTDLQVRGKVSGTMLVGAILDAQAVGGCYGGWGQRWEANYRAGVGKFDAYLGTNKELKEAWSRRTPLPPRVVVARASLNRAWLRKADEIITELTTENTRQKLLGQMLDAIMSPPDSFQQNKRLQYLNAKLQSGTVDAAELVDLLQPPIPEVELEMVQIPAGRFQIGSDRYPNEQFTDRQRHFVEISAFSIGRCKITNRQFEIGGGQMDLSTPEHWVDEGYGGYDPSNCNHPVVTGTWGGYASFLFWLGMRLPTEAEGEYAFRGIDNREYPWGDSLADFKKITHFEADTGKRYTIPVKAFPEVTSPFGVMDFGNGCEWREDGYLENYDPANLKDPCQSETDRRVIRGCSRWHSQAEYFLRCAARTGSHPDFTMNNIDTGLRVVAEADI